MEEGDKAQPQPPSISATLEETLVQPEAVLEHIGEGDDLTVGMHNSEPVTVVNAMEANAGRLSGVRAHQMFPRHERRYMHGVFPGLRHVSWFLSPASREAFRRGTCDLVPNNLSEVPSPMRRTTSRSLVAAAVAPPDRHGYFSLGTQADYAAAMILHATTADEPVSHITAQLHLGAAVTNFKNIVDRVVTEYGVAALRGSSIRERTRRLIAIAHPKFREELEKKAKGINYL